MSDNGAGWICKECGKEQTEPKGNECQKYCKVCKPIVHKKQMRDWQKAHLADHRSYRRTEGTP